MRIIGGEFRSRLLKSLPGVDVRPTPDRLRETLFNILSPVIAGSVFLDAYAGTGAVGIEALSRGARRAIFIEKSREAVALIQQNLTTLGIRSRSIIHVGAVARKISIEEADIIFLDPPYPQTGEYALALNAIGAAAREVIVVAQHSWRFPLEQQYGHLRQTREVRQSDNLLTFFRSEHAELEGSSDAAAEEAGGAALTGGDLEIPGTAGDHE